MIQPACHGYNDLYISAFTFLTDILANDHGPGVVYMTVELLERQVALEFHSFP